MFVTTTTTSDLDEKNFGFLNECCKTKNSIKIRLKKKNNDEDKKIKIIL